MTSFSSSSLKAEENPRDTDDLEAADIGEDQSIAIEAAAEASVAPRLATFSDVIDEFLPKVCRTSRQVS